MAGELHLTGCASANIDDLTSLALVIYDYFITFAQEFAFVWKRKWNLTTWLLVANRYLLIASVIFNVIVSLLGSNQVCVTFT